MILNESQMEQIIREICQRTADEKLDWYQENDRLIVDLPNRMSVEVLSNGGGSDLTVQIKGASGQLLGQVKSANDPSSLPGQLYASAAKRASKALFIDIMESLKLTDAVAVEVVPAPPRPTSDQVATVMRKMQGKWLLDFDRGQERVTITENGDYCIDNRSEPKFQLKVLAWNERTNTAEVAKDRLDGTRLQIEYLLIAPNSMTGHAKHDGHKLRYTRIAK